MDEKLREKVEKIMEDGNVGYAYLYPSSGVARYEFVFSMTPENIANFLGSHFLEARKMILTDLADRLILDTYGGFVDHCQDKELLVKILDTLAPIQRGMTKPQEFPIITRDEYDAYERWEDEQVTMAEMSMG